MLKVVEAPLHICMIDTVLRTNAFLSHVWFLPVQR